MTLVIAVGVAISNYMLITISGQVRWGVRGFLLALAGGFTAYLYLALGLPGSQSVLGTGLWGVILVALAGAVMGGAAAWMWRQRQALRKI